MKSIRIRSFSGPYFPAFGLNIQSTCEKIRTRKTPNTDTSCSVKPLNKSITSVFQVMYHIVRNHSNKCRYFEGVNIFCAISKKKAVITKVKNFNKRGESIMTFDFSTLYNKIPLNKLLQILYEMIDFCFNGRSQISL